MDDIPIFSGKKEELDSWVTCGQFISNIEKIAHNENFMEMNIKEFCLSKLSDPALVLFQKNFEKSWSELKNILFENFPVKLSIREKVEVRRGLQQSDLESIDDFYQRCLKAQYLVSDDVRDIGFEREVLLHFLIGLSPLIRDLVLATKCSSSNDYINEAKKYVQVIKEEAIPDVNVKIEVDPHYEEFDYKSQYEYDAFGDYFESEGVFEEVEKEVPIKKKKIKLLKTEMEKDQQRETCKECNKTFKTTKNLRDHIRNMHSTERSIMCDDCDKTFKYKKSLYEHVRRVHSGAEKKWKCEMCFVIFPLKYKEKHMKRIHKQCSNCDKLYVNRYKHYERWHSKGDACWYCDFIGENNKALQLHMKENHLNTPKMKLQGWKKCEICNEAIESQELLLEHQEKVHGHLKQTCEICNEVCITMKNLAIHIATKHCKKTPEKRFVCFYCNSVTRPTATLLGYHILNKHFNQPLFPCPQCGKGFDRKPCLASHIRYNHVTEKLFQCDKCAKNFKTHALLNSHSKNMHEEHEEVTCKHCNKTCKNAKYLRDHIRNMHSGAEKTRIICDDCGKSFAQKQSFLDHSLTHLTGKEKEQKKLSCPYQDCNYTNLRKPLLDTHIKRVHEKKKNFQCSLCPKSFFSKGHFEEHTNGVHLNLKPFQCEKCEFATAYRTILREHNKVAHGNRRYDCPYCNHSARYKGNLDKHINNVHKNLQSILTEKNVL